jgi:glycosyltransferase involved in cell wall biosynthesis
VVGDAGVLVDPLDIESIRGAMLRLARDGALRSELAARGKERARSFSWAKARDATCAVYRELACSA